MPRAEMGEPSGARRRSARTPIRAGPSLAPIPPLALSIKQFCAAHNLSVDMYFRMARLGTGPETMKCGARTLISMEAAARWRVAREVAAREQRATAKAEREQTEAA